MTELDKKITEIFLYLINSKTKYLTKIEYIPCKLFFNINEKEVIIHIFEIPEKLHKQNNHTKIDNLANHRLIDFIYNTDNKFVICFEIIIENKSYYLPKLERVEYSKALNLIDEIFEEKESKDLNDIINTYILDNSEEF